MDASAQAISIASAALPELRLHPLVLMHVYNQYVRRKDTGNLTKVIGALLGYKTEQGIEVSDCFSLPPPESLENRALEKYCDDWYALHSKVYSREQIVGWYISCDDDEAIMEWTSQLHEIFARRCERNGIQAVHLVVDTATAKSDMGAKAFVAKRVRLGPGMDIATAYHQIRVNLVASDSEKICMQHLVEGVGEDAEIMLKATEPLSQGFQRPAMLQTQLPTSHEALAGAIKRLETLISDVHTYVSDVVEGRQQPDAEIGAALADVMAEITPLDTQALESFFATKRQDLLMVEYLTSLTRTQVAIAEKLNAII